MKHRVVIADDDDDVRLLLRVVLDHEADFEVVGEASNPNDAITVANEHQPDVVVIDHEFRGYTSGTEAAPTIRTNCPHALLVMFSAYDAIRVQTDTSNIIDAFVLKTDIALLPSIVRSMLNDRQ